MTRRFRTRRFGSALFLLFGLLNAPRSWAGPPSAVDAVVTAGREQVGKTTIYDPAYVKLSYPGGDLPLERGVCADVIIRAFRAGGVDLQELVHRDMAGHFSQYPRIWGLKATDANIDHRRVANLMTFFKRAGKALKISDQSADYRVGDVVAWRLDNGLLHIGLVLPTRSPDGLRPLMVHNIGAGAQIEDVLFAFEIIGHYRYF